MDFMNLLGNAPELTNLLGKFLNVLFVATKNFGWAVVLFTLVIKAIMSPIDVWQKHAMRKQSKAMARLQPELQKLQKQYANKPDILKVKQAELYKKQNIKMLSSCIPMILTFVLFFVVFSGFNSMVKYQNEKVIFDLYQIYEANKATMDATQLNALLASSYHPESWLWVKNVFMPDNWSSVIPSFEKFVGNGIGGIRGTMPEGIDLTEAYSVLVGPAITQYNGSHISKWNGYLILPILSIVTSLLSTKLMQAANPQAMAGTEKQQNQQKSTMKVMMFVMPIMIGAFSLFYSAAFSLYLFVGNIFTTILNLVYNIITKKKDAAEKDAELSTTYRRVK